MCTKKYRRGLESAIKPSFYSSPVLLNAGKTLKLDGVEFVATFDRLSTATRFCIAKPPVLYQRYLDLLPEYAGGRIVEIGIRGGGSTAMIALVAKPARFVALEIDEERVAALDELIAKRKLTNSVRPHYGVDQSDRAAVASIVDDAMQGRAIDLVLDDASHLYEETRASFEVLFPRLRPGGLFIIEDWPAQYVYAAYLGETLSDPAAERYGEFKAILGDAVRSGQPRLKPLAQLGVELMFASALHPEVVASVEVNKHWVTVTRGGAPLNSDTFQVSDLYRDYFRWFSGGWNKK
jgi:predicted O-methyltransferase YrrM